MSILATTIIDDVKEEFEGGSSLGVNWDALLRSAVRNLLDNCRPETGKRRVPIYGGLAQDLYAYYCPSDVLVPSDLYDNNGQLSHENGGTRKFKFSAPKKFYQDKKNNTYTIEYINGVRWLIVNHTSTKSILTVDAMDAVGTKTGGTPTLNEHNYLTGTGAVQFTATDAGVEFGDTLTTAINITDYLRGVAIIPAHFDNEKEIASIELRLKTSTGNYYSVISTADSIGDYFADGWNLIRFNLANRTTTGSPSASSIASWSIVATTTSGNTETIIIDKITIQNSAVWYLEYYTNKLFIDGSTSVWQSTVSYANNDLVNIDRDLENVLHYELCLLVTQSATFDKIDSSASKRFEGQLRRAYNAYWAVHPSSEEPMSYSILPEIDLDRESISNGRVQDDTEDITT